MFPKKATGELANGGFSQLIRGLLATGRSIVAARVSSVGYHINLWLNPGEQYTRTLTIVCQETELFAKLDRLLFTASGVLPVRISEGYRPPFRCAASKRFRNQRENALRLEKPSLPPISLSGR